MGVSVGDDWCGFGWRRFGWWFSAPDELAILIAFCEDADQAWLAIEYPADVGWGYTGVAPGGGDCDAHEVGR